MNWVYQPEYATPADYVQACEDAVFNRQDMPIPVSRDEHIALAVKRPDLIWRVWPASDWREHLGLPERPEDLFLDDEQKEQFLRTLARDVDFRTAVSLLIGGRD